MRGAFLVPREIAPIAPLDAATAVLATVTIRDGILALPGTRCQEIVLDGHGSQDRGSLSLL